MDTLRSIELLAAAAVAEIGGAHGWSGKASESTQVRIWIGAGIIALGIYGLVATLHLDARDFECRR